LPLKSQYKLSSLLFVANNKSHFTTNLDIDSIHTGHSNDLHLHQANLPIYRKEVFYSGVKTANNLPLYIKNTSGNLKTFKRILKHVLITHFSYTSEEYYSR